MCFSSRKCVIFLVSLSSRCAHVLLGRKTKATDQSFSFLKIFLFYDNKIETTCKNQSIYQITVALKKLLNNFKEVLSMLVAS